MKRLRDCGWLWAGMLMLSFVRYAACGQTAEPLQLTGYNDMEPMLRAVEPVYVARVHRHAPTLRLPGTATGAGALALGISDAAPMGAEFSERELAAFRGLRGEPLIVRVAHCAMDPKARSAPIGIYVNVANPVRELTMTQVARIFTAGQPGGDLTMWKQLTPEAAWRDRAVVPVGIAEEESAGISPYMLGKMGGEGYADGFVPELQSRDVVKYVAEHAEAIGFASANFVDARVRLVAIAKAAGEPFVAPTPETVVAGRYAYDRYLYFYVPRDAAGRIDARVREYLEVLLSDDGQAAIAGARPGYLPLNEAERLAERGRLE